MNLGYCCINLTLQNEGISTNRKLESPVTNLRIKKWLHENCNGKSADDDSIIHDWYHSTIIVDKDSGKELNTLQTSCRTFKSITKSVIVDGKVSLSDDDVSKKGHLKWFCKLAGDKAILNLSDLLKVLEWNVANDIRVFRMSSSLFPWMSEYEFSELPNYSQIQEKLIEIGDYILKNDLRVGFHPGQYCVLPSPTEEVVINTIDDLDKHSQILDLMGLPQNHKYSLNIHVGGSYGDKSATLRRFCANWLRLSESAQRRLVIENDDKPSQYSVQDLYDGLYRNIGIPITFDFFHHLFCTGDLSQSEAATLAASTWPSGIRPLAHFSSSKKLNEDSNVIERSHADFLYDSIPPIGKLFDIEIEAKAKELALFKYIKKQALNI